MRARLKRVWYLIVAKVSEKPFSCHLHVTTMTLDPCTISTSSPDIHLWFSPHMHNAASQSQTELGWRYCQGSKFRKRQMPTSTRSLVKAPTRNNSSFCKRVTRNTSQSPATPDGPTLLSKTTSFGLLNSFCAHSSVVKSVILVKIFEMLLDQRVVSGIKSCCYFSQIWVLRMIGCSHE